MQNDEASFNDTNLILLFQTGHFCTPLSLAQPWNASKNQNSKSFSEKKKKNYIWWHIILYTLY